MKLKPYLNPPVATLSRAGWRLRLVSLGLEKVDDGPAETGSGPAEAGVVWHSRSISTGLPSRLPSSGVGSAEAGGELKQSVRGPRRTTGQPGSRQPAAEKNIG